MSIRLIAALALCARVGSDELDPCSGVSSTYVDPVTNVLHDCWFICESIIRAYREHCKAYCPEYYQCKENHMRVSTAITVQAAVVNTPTYPAMALYGNALDESLIGDQQTQHVIIYSVITIAIAVLALVIVCLIAYRKRVRCRQFEECKGGEFESHQQVVERSHAYNDEPVSDTHKANLSFAQPQATNEAIGTVPSQIGSSFAGYEGEQKRINNIMDPERYRNEHHRYKSDCGDALASNLSCSVTSERDGTTGYVAAIVDSPSILQIKESHWADPYGCSNVQDTQPRKYGQDTFVPPNRDSQSELPNTENDALLSSPHCNILAESFRQAEPDDAYTSLSETESAYQSTPCHVNRRTNAVLVDDPLLDRDYGSHYPSTLTGSPYSILGMEQRNSERRAFQASNQSVYDSQQPSLNCQIDQETRPKAQMTMEA